MKFTNWSDTLPIHRDEVFDRFTNWYQELVAIIESRIFSGCFTEIVNRLSQFGDAPITRLTFDEIEDQLTLCSQYRFTFSETGSELKRYRMRIETRFEIWMAKKRTEAKNALLLDQKVELDSGLITKSNYGKTTAVDIQDRLIIDNEIEYQGWMDFISDVDGAYKFLYNLAEDLEYRGTNLRALRKTV